MEPLWSHFGATSLPLFASNPFKRHQTGTMLPLWNCSSSMEAEIYMAGKPYQSCLIPYENEILALRRRRPPVSFARISELLRNEHQLSVCRQTVCKFLKVRVAKYKNVRQGPNMVQENSLQVAPRQAVKPANTNTISPDKPVFEFTYSERYNLHRLPKEEAAAIRKKLEAEGH